MSTTLTALFRNPSVCRGNMKRNQVTAFWIAIAACLIAGIN